jgi:hypothetical protein
MSSSIALYIDEQFPINLAVELRNHGVDVLTTQEAQRAGTPDEDQLNYATTHGRVLVTQDKDFLELAISHYHLGIIYARQSLQPGIIVEDLVLIAKAAKPEELEQQIWWLPLVR